MIMVKIFLYIISTLLIISCSQESVNLNKRENINNDYVENLIYDSIYDYLKVKEEYLEKKLIRSIIYNKDGFVIEARDYLCDGTIAITFYSDKGSPSSKVYLTKDDIEIRDYIKWHQNGNIAIYGEYCTLGIGKDTLTLKFESISTSGTVKTSMQFNNKCNLWKYWNKEGKLIKEEFWEKGVLKETKEYDKEGNLIKK